MSAGIEIYNYVSNQKGTPALYSDILANRPAAGFLGRLFISTDTLEIYRDTGTAWALISGGGGGSVNIYNSDGTLTAARTVTMAGHNLTFEGGAGTNRIRMSADAGQARIFSFASADVARWAFRVDGAESGSNAGADWALMAYNDAGVYQFSPIAANRSTGEKTLYAQGNITAGTQAVTSVFNIAGITYGAGLTMIGGNAHGAQFNNYTLANAGNLTFASSSFVGASGNVLRLQGNASGTVTMQASSPGVRTAAVSLNQIQYNTTGGTNITYTHAANIQGLGILRIAAAGSLTVTNAYGLLLNDLNEYGYASTGAGALSITNRWGIYQDSTTDANYLGGSVLIGTTTNAGFKTDINGTFRAVSTVTLSSLGGVGTRMVVADASGVLSTQAIPGGGGISGSGTTNYVAKFTGASSIGNSQLFDNGTNVGVGTNSPAAKLHVFSFFTDSLIEEVFRIQRSGLSSYNAERQTSLVFADELNPTLTAAISGLRNNPSGNFLGGITFRVSKSVSTPITSVSALSEVGRITSSGEFLINGTLNPYSAVNRGNLTITGTSTQILAFTNGTVGTGYIYYNGTNLEIQANTGAVITYTNSTVRQTITSGGNVLINTTTDAGFQLDVNGSTRLNGTLTYGSAGNNIGATFNNSGLLDFQASSLSTGIRFGTSAASPATIYTNGASRVTVTGAGGFVGISTTTPSVQLSLGSSLGDRLAVYDAGASILFGFGVQANLFQQYAPLDSAITLGHGTSTSLTRRFTMFPISGNIGMNTTTDSGQRLQVAGTARIFGTALPHLLIEQTAATGNVELQFSATDASYPAIIRSKAAQSIAFKDGTNSNLDIYSAGQLSIGGGGAPFGSTNTLTVLAGTAPTATASDCFTLYSKDITAGNAAPHFITENGAIVKIYQETTSVAAAAFTANSGTAINDASTFDGYTLRQIVKALRNLGILQ